MKTAANLTLVAIIAVALMVFVHPAAAQTDSNAVAWDYSDADVSAGAVSVFLVCLDGQPTASCARVLASTGVATSTAGVKSYQWKLPAITPGSHRVAVQACTLNLADCSSGSTLTFVVKVTIANPSNLRLSKVGA